MSVTVPYLERGAGSVRVIAVIVSLIGDETMKNLFKRIWKAEDGAAMVEYALLVALIALVAIAGVTATGTGINAQFSKISCKITTPSADCN